MAEGLDMQRAGKQRFYLRLVSQVLLGLTQNLGCSCSVAHTQKLLPDTLQVLYSLYMHVFSGHVANAARRYSNKLERN